MQLEEWQQTRIVTIARMAATIEAGDHSAWTDNDCREIKSAESYAKRAQQLFDAVASLEDPR